MFTARLKAAAVVNESPFQIRISRPQATHRTNTSSAPESDSSISVDGSINSRIDASIEVDTFEPDTVAVSHNDIMTTEANTMIDISTSFLPTTLSLVDRRCSHGMHGTID
jgi:hypothetical protein